MPMILDPGIKKHYGIVDEKTEHLINGLLDELFQILDQSQLEWFIADPPEKSEEFEDWEDEFEDDGSINSLRVLVSDNKIMKFEINQ